MNAMVDFVKWKTRLTYLGQCGKGNSGKEGGIFMKPTWKPIGSILLSVCMVFTLLPAMAFAKVQDSGAPLGVNETITVFSEPSGDVAEQNVKTGAAGTDITSKFTDANFLAEVRSRIGKAADARIYDTDLASVLVLNVRYKNIASLAGIEYFTALQDLDCAGNQLTSLDVSKNTALQDLYCSSNQLTALDVSKNTTLTELRCNNNQLTALNVSSNTALTTLWCDGNALTSLDVSMNTALKGLDCYSNQLTALDVSKNTALQYLSCHSNKLTALDVSNKTALTGLYCYSNQLTALDVSGSTALTQLDCYKNQLTSLDVSGNTALTRLDCYKNQLTSLDVSNNTKLIDLSCYENQLTSLDVSKNTTLQYLNCYDNQLKSLNVSNNTKLTDLSCYNNQLKVLDVSNNTALGALFCSNNKLTELDVSNNTVVGQLNCSYNYLISLDVSRNTKLAYLTCNYNYFPDKSAIKGLNESLTFVLYNPQNSGTPPADTDAATPSITGQPSGAIYTQNGTAAALTVTANVTDGGTLSYQWYKNTVGTIGGTVVSTSGDRYTPSTATVGTTYYYCVVTNTNNSASGKKTATATSRIAVVTVEVPKTPYVISASASNTAYGTVSGGGSFISGTTITLKATPKAGYRFVRWLEGSARVSDSAEYKFIVSKSRSLKAEFAAIAVPSVTATSAGYSSVKLSWKAITGAKEYEVYRSTSSSSGFTKVATTASTSYTSTSLTTNKTYYFKVRAKCVATTKTTYGIFSAVKSAKPVPATPGSPKAASAGYSSVKVSWSSVPGTTRYQVYGATSKTGTYKKLTETTSTSYTHKSLTTGKTYYYKVRAYRTVSGKKVYGSYTTVVSAKPVPATPGSVKATRASSTSIKVSWGKVSGATKYVLYRATSKAGSYSKVTVTSSTSYTDTKLTSGKGYYYKVRAYRTVGTSKIYSAYSKVVSAKQ